jgi:tetraacyldisaccharide-1-P 4'-kinase
VLVLVRFEDDASLLEVGLRGSGVCVIRAVDRWWSWLQADATGGFDLLVSDGGVEDPRLDGARTLLLDRPGGGSPARWSNLLPCGRWRSFPADHPEVDWRWRTDGFIGWQLREPEGLERAVPRTLVTGLGDPQAALAMLLSAGWNIVRLIRVPDHSPKIATSVELALRRWPDPCLIAEKDACKLPSVLRGDPRVACFGFECRLPPARLEELWRGFARLPPCPVHP